MLNGRWPWIGGILALASWGAEFTVPVPNDWVRLGEIQLRRGMIDRAGESFARAIQEDAAAVGAWQGLARVAEAKFDSESAGEHWQRVRELSQDAGKLLPRRRLSVPVTFDMPEAERTAAVWRLETLVEKTQIKLEPVSNGGNLHGYGLEIRLNGGRAVRVLIDTGATGLLLARDLMPENGARPVGVNLVRGVGEESGIRPVPIVKVDRVRAGPLEFRDALVQVADRELLVGLDGILGADVFADFLVTLDFPGRRLGLEHREATREEGFERVFRHGHALLVPARLNREETVLLQIDSGANRSLLDEAVARRTSRVTDDPLQQVRGISGVAARVLRVEHAEIAVGEWRRSPRNVLAISLARQNQHRPFEVHGIIGLPELRDVRLSIDYTRGLIKFGK